MAKVKGIVHIEGSMDDFVFYTLQGIRCVRRKDKKQSERIKSDANFERTRENNREFGQCSGSGKLLRQALAPMLLKAKDERLASRMLGVMAKIKDLDTLSMRGERKVSEGIKTVEGQLLLKGFDFNIHAPLSSVLKTGWEVDPDTGRVLFVDFNPGRQLTFPMGATHARFMLAATRVDFDTFKHTTAYSEATDVPSGDTPVSLVLAMTPPPEGNGSVFYILSLSFFQEMNGQLYSLQNEKGNVLHVLEAF